MTQELPIPTPEIGQTFYRFFDPEVYEEGGPWYQEYKVTRLTPTGFFIADYGNERYINRHWYKRYAHATLEEARESYRHRKEKQVTILTAQLEHAKTCLANWDKPNNTNVTFELLS